MQRRDNSYGCINSFLGRGSVWYQRITAVAEALAMRAVGLHRHGVGVECVADEGAEVGQKRIRRREIRHHIEISSHRHTRNGAGVHHDATGMPEVRDTRHSQLEQHT